MATKARKTVKKKLGNPSNSSKISNIKPKGAIMMVKRRDANQKTAIY